MYDRFRWTNVSARRNGLTMEYEPLQPFFAVALASSAGCGTFIDVGANIGAYSLFATLIPGIERIVAFEANRETAEELKANIALNRLQDRVEVWRNAVSAAAGQLNFGVVSSFSGANSIVETSIHDASTFHKQVTVEAITLDDVFSESLERPIAIKIDVEGHEREVIAGARKMLQSNRAVIQLEGYGDTDEGSIGDLQQLGYALLTKIGPDHYMSNLGRFNDPAEVVRVYEEALLQLIAYNHRNKAVMLKRGDLGLQLTGNTAALARRLAKRFVGKRF